MRKWLAPLFAPLLAGCQPPPPFVIAMIEAGKLTFHIRHRGLVTDRIFGWDDENHTVERLAIVESNSAIIRFERGGDAAQSCQSSARFPIQIAEQHCGYNWTGSRNVLRPNVTYEIYLDSCSGLPTTCDDGARQYWSDWPMGRFQLAPDGSVSNVRTD